MNFTFAGHNDNKIVKLHEKLSHFQRAFFLRPYREHNGKDSKNTRTNFNSQTRKRFYAFLTVIKWRA